MTGGDNAQAGMEAEYDAFFRAFDGIGAPLRVVRGNHDRGYFGRRMERLLPSPRREPADRGSEEPVIYVWNGAYWDVHTHNVLNLLRTEEVHYPFWRRTQAPVLQLRDRREYAYSFEEKGRRFIVLNTSPWILSGNQTDWLRRELTDASGPPVVVFLHHSLLPCGIVFDAAPL